MFVPNPVQLRVQIPLHSPRDSMDNLIRGKDDRLKGRPSRLSGLFCRRLKMYHALEIQEILLNILGHLYSPTWRAASALANLACTCRALKDPALDVLWEELYDLSPLVRCLPEASHQSPTELIWQGPIYVFTRPPTNTEWDTLRSHTRRIRSIQNMDTKLDQQTLTTLLNPPAADLHPLFPNLCHLRCAYTPQLEPLSHLPLPSLISLDLRFTHSHAVRTYFESSHSLYPNIKRLDIEIMGSSPYELDCQCFQHWKNLQSVRCRRAILGWTILAHLSHMAALTELTFVFKSSTSPTSSPISFSNLHHLSLQSVSLARISKLLSHIQIPSVTYFCALLDECPAARDVLPFFTGVQTSKATHTVETLFLVQSSFEQMDHLSASPPHLDMDKLRPCLAFTNLRLLFIDLVWDVSLTDMDLFALALAWPRLEQLCINEHWGWHTPNGITPNGLRQLLEICPSLGRVALAMDTRGYTEFTPLPLSSSACAGSLLPTLSINVLDATIDGGCVPAVAAFFASIAPSRRFALAYWDSYRTWQEAEFPFRWEVKRRWDDVYKLAVEMVGERC